MSEKTTEEHLAEATRAVRLVARENPGAVVFAMLDVCSSRSHAATTMPFAHSSGCR